MTRVVGKKEEVEKKRERYTQSYMLLFLKRNPKFETTNASWYSKMIVKWKQQACVNKIKRKERKN